MTNTLGRVAGNSLIYITGEIITKGSYFLLIPLYTRYITPAENGILGASLAVRNFLTIVFFTIIVNIVTRYYYSFKELERRVFFGTLWISLILITCSLLILSKFFGAQIFLIIYKQIPYYPYGQLVLLTGLILVISDRFSLALLRVQEKAKQYVVFIILAFTAKTSFTIYFVVIQGEQALGALKGELFGAVIMLLPFCSIIMKNISLKMSWKYLYEIGKFGLPLIPHAIASWGLALSDILILERYVSLHALGIYTLSRQFARMTGIIISAIGNAWSPFFMKNTIKSYNPEVVDRSTMLYLGGVVTAGMGVALLSPGLIRIMAAPQYHAAAMFVSIISLAYIGFGLYIIPSNILQINKKTKYMSLSTGLSLLTSVILNIVFIPNLGIVAATWVTIPAYSVMFIVAFIASYRWNIISYDWKRIFGYAIICCIFYTAASMIRISSPLIELVLKGFLLLICIIISMSYLMHFSIDDWGTIIQKFVIRGKKTIGT